jgi:nitrogen-specific signal transduction histidine kinase
VAGDESTISRQWVRISGEQDHEMMGVILLEDVTEEMRLREEILKNGRLTAVLDTWAALNHEINNPLAAILGRAQILLARAQELDERTRAGLKVIEESALRIVELTARVGEIKSPSFTDYSRGVRMLDIKASRLKKTGAA